MSIQNFISKMLTLAINSEAYIYTQNKVYWANYNNVIKSINREYFSNLHFIIHFWGWDEGFFF